MRDWSDTITAAQHYLSGAGYNEESDQIRKISKGHIDRDKVQVDADVRYLIVSNETRCLVIKLNAYRKLNKKQRDTILSIGERL